MSYLRSARILTGDCSSWSYLQNALIANCSAIALILQGGRMVSIRSMIRVPESKIQTIPGTGCFPS